MLEAVPVLLLAPPQAEPLAVQLSSTIVCRSTLQFSPVHPWSNDRDLLINSNSSIQPKVSHLITYTMTIHWRAVSVIRTVQDTSEVHKYVQR